MSVPDRKQPGQLKVVQGLIMGILEGFGTPVMIEQLRGYARDHGSDCALGSAPACTCGYKEAYNFTRLFEGKVSGQQLLVPEPVGTNEADSDIYLYYTDPGTLLHP